MGVGDSRVKRRGLSVATTGGGVGHHQDPQPRSGGGGVEQSFSGPIVGAVVDDDRFKPTGQFVQRSVQLVDQRRDIGFFVMRGRDDAESDWLGAGRMLFHET